MSKIVSARSELISLGNGYCANMQKRGGGVVNVEAFVRQPRASSRAPFVVVHVDIDVKDAMGANLVNTVAEGMASRLVLPFP